MNEEEKIKEKKIRKKRRTNAILYPIYKMLSWDLLCFYCIEFLFYTITKGVSASEVLVISASYIFFKVLFQIPSVMIADYFGKRKSIILGNGLLIIYILILMWAPNLLWLILANIFCGFGYGLKVISESNLLYDSVATHGGDGIYTKIDSKGASAYYVVDMLFAMIAGYLFVINQYLPLMLCMVCLIISFILSFQFKDIHRSIKQKSNKKFSEFMKGYKDDIKESFQFLKRSKRLKAYFIFATFFYGIIKVAATYRSNLMTDLGITPEQFSMIYGGLSLVAAVSASFSKKIQKQFRNKTLTVLSLTHIVSMLLAGIISSIITNNMSIPFVLVCCILMRICDAQWYVTEYTYLKNFTNHETRNKITFTYEIIMCIGAVFISIICAAILKFIPIRYTMIFTGLLFLAVAVVILDYMKTRFGLKPNQYTKEDLVFKMKEEKENIAN